jgi:myosin heavy subunit
VRFFILANLFFNIWQCDLVQKVQLGHKAFGNARTVRNNNSSRFGRFTEILFNGHMQIYGARIKQYLLEKSRIIKQSEGERNYHIFYQLCFCGDQDLIKELKLAHPERFHYTNQSKTYSLGKNDPPDVKAFGKLRDAMAFLSFTPEEQMSLFRVTASVLHLGNLEFVDGPGESSMVKNGDVIETISRLLAIPMDKLEESLTVRYNTVRGETFRIPLKPLQARAACDAIAKALYGNMFVWLVDRVNRSITASEGLDKADAPFIGVLDIFGFENFKENSFEQLCKWNSICCIVCCFYHSTSKASITQTKDSSNSLRVSSSRRSSASTNRRTLSTFKQSVSTTTNAVWI